MALMLSPRRSATVANEMAPTTATAVQSRMRSALRGMGILELRRNNTPQFKDSHASECASHPALDGGCRRRRHFVCHGSAAARREHQRHLAGDVGAVLL